MLLISFSNCFHLLMPSYVTFRLGLEEEFHGLDFQFQAKEWSDSYAGNFFLPRSAKLSTLGQDSFPVKGTKKKSCRRKSLSSLENALKDKETALPVSLPLPPNLFLSGAALPRMWAIEWILFHISLGVKHPWFLLLAPPLQAVWSWKTYAICLCFYFS